MRAVVVVILLLCVVSFIAAPVSADYFLYKDVNATKLTTALVDYCNGNTVYKTKRPDMT